MNLTDPKFRDFALVQEMLQTPAIMRSFNFAQAQAAAEAIQKTGRLMLTGEGSSRIFPAKNLMVEVLRRGIPLAVFTEGARQAHDYNLADSAVFAASNSGQTKEVISLFTKLAAAGHQLRFGLTANQNTRLAANSNQCYVLSCGEEKAVAATKSVVEQALFYRALLETYGPSTILQNQAEAADKADEVLKADLDSRIVSTIAKADMIYFAGRNDGVAEELTLKTNEITRKKSDFLEGTYAVHGIEEVMNPTEVVIVVEPFAAEAEKFRDVLVDSVGMPGHCHRLRRNHLPHHSHSQGRRLRRGAPVAGRLERARPRRCGQRNQPRQTPACS